MNDEHGHSSDHNPGVNAIQVMTMKVSKVLEFPEVALPEVGHMLAAGEDEKEAARVFYVAATRATQRLMMGVGGDGSFGKLFFSHLSVDAHPTAVDNTSLWKLQATHCAFVANR